MTEIPSAQPQVRTRRSLKVEVDIEHLLRLRSLKLVGKGNICDHIDAALDLYFAQRRVDPLVESVARDIGPSEAAGA